MCDIQHYLRSIFEKARLNGESVVIIEGVNIQNLELGDIYDFSNFTKLQFRDCTFSGTSFSSFLTTELHFENCYFYDDTSFYDSDKLLFRDCEFSGNVQFDNISEIELKNTYFLDGGVYFKNSKIKELHKTVFEDVKELEFKACRVVTMTNIKWESRDLLAMNFLNVTVEKGNIRDVTFPKGAYFTEIRIEESTLQNVAFQEAHFSGKIVFKNITIIGILDFTNANFEGDVEFIFKKISFNSAVFFVKTIFNGSFYVSPVQLQNISFLEATLPENIKLREIKYSENSRILSEIIMENKLNVGILNNHPIRHYLNMDAIIQEYKKLIEILEAMDGNEPIVTLLNKHLKEVVNKHRKEHLMNQRWISRLEYKTGEFVRVMKDHPKTSVFIGLLIVILTVSLVISHVQKVEYLEALKFIMYILFNLNLGDYNYLVILVIIVFVLLVSVLFAPQMQRE